MSENNKLFTFWHWFFYGTGGSPGWTRLLNSYLIVHLIFGVALTYLIELPVSDVAENALLPMLAVFIGLTFSWAGNAHSLMQTPEVQEIASNKPGGIYEYVYTFQLSILIMLVTIGLWTLAMLEPRAFIQDEKVIMLFNLFATIFLYASGSLTLRTCWHAVVGTNMLLLWRSKYKK